MNNQLRRSEKKGTKSNILSRSAAILYSFVDLFLSSVIYAFKLPEDNRERHVTACKQQRVNDMGVEHWDSTDSGLHEKEHANKQMLCEIANTTFVFFAGEEMCIVEQRDGGWHIRRYAVHDPEYLVTPS